MLPQQRKESVAVKMYFQNPIFLSYLFTYLPILLFYLFKYHNIDQIIIKIT